MYGIERIKIPPEATPTDARALFDAYATPVEERDTPYHLVAKCECGGKRFDSLGSDETIPCAEIEPPILREIRIGGKSIGGLVPHCRNFASGWSFSDTRIAADVFSKDLDLAVESHSSPWDVVARKRCSWHYGLDRGEFAGLTISRANIDGAEFPDPFVRAHRGDKDWYLKTDIDRWWRHVQSLASSDKGATKAKAVRRPQQACIYLVYGQPLDRAGLIGYIGQTIDYGKRRHAHLVRGDETTRGLLETLRAKGVTVQMKIVKKCTPKALNAEEVRWFRTYRESGWVLWNRSDLTGGQP